MVKLKKRKKIRKFRISPYFKIIFSFMLIIFLGSLLLMLPISHKGDLEYIDALFVSTSASCVTGLNTLPNVVDYFTIFGKIILVILMEIGGLSIITIATFAMVIFGRKLGISSRMFLSSALNQNNQRGILDLLKSIVIISFSIQGVFIIINLIILLLSGKGYSFFTALGISAFHTASSFNNAGFDIFGSNSMIDFSTNIALNISTIILIVLGGLGFMVIIDIIHLRENKHLSFHSKIVIIMTMLLIVIPTVVFRFTMNVTWLESLFTSVTARTAGFTTIDFSEKMAETSAYPLFLILMFIGASPSSTGGGVKTTTFFTILITIVFAIVGKKPKVFKRNIAEESIIKSFSLILMSMFYVLLLISGLKVFNPEISMNALVFEAFSAFGTVGVSMGITSSLAFGSKILIIITMFIGRVGPLSFVSFWSKSFMQDNQNVQFIEEKIIIG